MRIFFFYLLFAIISGVQLFGQSISLEKRKENDSFWKKMFHSEEKILSEKITALIFFDHPENLLLDAKEEKGIVFKGMDFPEKQKFIAKMQPFLGKPLTKTNLNKIKQETIDFLQKNSSNLTTVKILEGQDITTGQLKILVLLGRLGDIEVIGAKNFSKTWISKQIKTKPGQVIDINQNKTDLYWLNRNPFRSVSLIYKPGVKLGLTQMQLFVQDQTPFKVYGGYENTGNEIAGASRFLGGISWGNVCGINHELNAEFKSAADANRFWSVFGNYIAPFPWRHILKVYGGYVETKPKTADINTNGKAWFSGGRYHIPFKLINFLQHEAVVGYDFKQTNNFLTFADEEIFNNLFDISQFLLRYEGMEEDKYGVSSFALSIFLSPGNMTRYNKTADFQVARAKAKSNYIYSTLNFERSTHLFYDFAWILNSYFQISSGRLLPSEEFSLGGMNTIRGYQENLVYGDDGFFFRNELRTNLLHLKLPKKAKNDLQFLAFLDLGWVNKIDKSVFDKKSAFLASFGPGVRYTVKDNVKIVFDYGVQLKSLRGRIVSKKPWDGRAHLQAIIQF